jgi:uncharacterized phage protein (TIGR01671 family)
MKEILFRGFHPSEYGAETICVDGEKITGEWVFGDLLRTSNRTPFIMTDGTYQGSCFVIPSTVGQFTGLCDKNGKRIFEGDIVTGCPVHLTGGVALTTDNGVSVRFESGMFKAGSISICSFRGNCEVIGTIFDSKCSFGGEDE